MAPWGSTLGERLARRDEQRFVGRENEITFFESLLVDDDPPASVVLVHGPGGIGKSTLLREVARLGERHGRSPRIVDARELAPVPGEIESALEGVEGEPRPLAMFDTFERMAAASAYLRQRLLPSLPERSLVILAGRTAPEPEWFQGGWERLGVDYELGPLGHSDARTLLREHGIEDDAREGGGWDPRRIEDRPELVRALIRHLARTELDGGNLDVIAVAALARGGRRPAALALARTRA